MGWKIGLAGDLHKRAKDISTIQGYVNCNIAVQRDLMRLIKETNMDYFISLGDWYDKGYTSDVSASLADYDIDIEMANLLNGKFYGLIGNHIRLNMDSNPELHLIQPHPVYKSRRTVIRQEQVMKTPKMLRLGTVQISFMHHNKDVDDVFAYKPRREEWATYHIALFHTPSIVPNAQLVKTNFGYNASSNSKIGEVLNGVDLAIVGDIHTPLGQFNINTPTGTTIMVVPGSLTNVDSSEDNRHTSIMLPVISIDDDSSVKLEYIHFDLKTNLLTFMKKNIEESKEKLKSLRGKPVRDLHGDDDIVSIIGRRENAYTTLNGFMQASGYTDVDKQLIRSVINNPADLDSLIKIYKG